MITPSFSLTATERVLPKLALDFTTASLDSRITFTRTTGASNPATYIDNSGYVTAATNNQPRFDYDPVTLACKGLLIEESRVNLFFPSDDLSDAAWTTNSTDITATNETVASCFGSSSTMTKWLIGSNASARILGPGSTSISLNTDYTLSIIVKRGTSDWVQIGVYDPTATVGGFRGWFNLATGAKGSGSTGGANAVFTSSDIKDMGNGCYRISITGKFTNIVTSVRMIYYPVTGDNSTTRNANTYTYVRGAQLEAGAFATSYIPTTTTALTRNADVATMTGTNFSDWFNASEGTFVVSFDTAGAGPSMGSTVIGVSDNTIGNRIRIYRTTSTLFEAAVASTVQWSLGSATSANATTVVSAAYKLNDVGVSINSGTVSTDLSASVPTVSQMQIGNLLTGRELNGHVGKVSYFTQRLTNAETQAFSKG